MKKTEPIGLSKVIYDKENKLLVIQWNDNKFVSVILSLGLSGKGVLKRRKVSQLLEFACEKVLIEYQKNMGEVDR